MSRTQLPKTLDMASGHIGRTSPSKSDDWAAALQLLHVSVQRDVSPSRATLTEERQLPATFPTFQGSPHQGNHNIFGNSPPPSHPTSVQDMLFGPSSSSSSKTGTSQSVQQLFGDATSQLHQLDHSIEKTTSSEHIPSPRANNMISLSSLEQNLPISNDKTSSAPPPPPARANTKVQQAQEKSILDENADVDHRAMPLLFGQNQQQAVGSLLYTIIFIN